MDPVGGGGVRTPAPLGRMGPFWRSQGPTRETCPRGHLRGIPTSISHRFLCGGCHMHICRNMAGKDVRRTRAAGGKSGLLRDQSCRRENKPGGIIWGK